MLALVAGRAGAAAPLPAPECLALASRDSGTLPELCVDDAYRDELVAYMNIFDLYMLEPGREESRFVDRIELKSDLSENSLTVGKGRITLRMNSFLRPRDAKDFLTTVKERLQLVKASAETDKLFKQLATSPVETSVNLRAPLKSFLDAPFLGEAGNVIAADGDLPSPSSPDGLRAGAVDPVPSEQALSAISDKDCQKIREDLARRKMAVTEELSDIKKAHGTLAEALQTRPVLPLKPRPGQTLASLADQVERSDCDQCFGAVYHCKAKGALPGFVPTENNCRRVFETKACYASLPASLMVPVHGCVGVPVNQTQSLWAQRESSLRKLQAQIDGILGKSGIEGCKRLPMAAAPLAKAPAKTKGPAAPAAEPSEI